MPDFADHLQEALGTNYKLDRELVGGGMSRVFVAVDSVLGRRVVVKVLPPELAAGVNRDRFRREIQVAAQLQHPHIVPLPNVVIALLSEPVRQRLRFLQDARF